MTRRVLSTRWSTNEMKPHPGVILGFLVLLFLLGGWFGQSVEPDPPARYHTDIITETETVTETQTEYVPDPACLEVGRLARGVIQAAQKTSKATPEMLRIMSELRIAVATRSSHAANELETQLRVIDSSLDGSAERLGTSIDKLTEAMEECNG